MRERSTSSGGAVFISAKSCTKKTGLSCKGKGRKPTSHDALRHIAGTDAMRCLANHVNISEEGIDHHQLFRRQTYRQQKPAARSTAMHSSTFLKQSLVHGCQPDPLTASSIEARACIMRYKKRGPRRAQLAAQRVRLSRPVLGPRWLVPPAVPHESIVMTTGQSHGAEGELLFPIPLVNLNEHHGEPRQRLCLRLGFVSVLTQLWKSYVPPVDAETEPRVAARAAKRLPGSLPRSGSC